MIDGTAQGSSTGLANAELVRTWNRLGAEQPNMSGPPFSEYTSGDTKSWAPVAQPVHLAAE